MQPAPLDGPPVDESDPRALRVGLPSERLRAVLPEVGWAPLGLVRHLGPVERRWLRWGFAAERVEANPAGRVGGHRAE